MSRPKLDPKAINLILTHLNLMSNHPPDPSTTTTNHQMEDGISLSSYASSPAKSPNNQMDTSSPAASPKLDAPKGPPLDETTKQHKHPRILPPSPSPPHEMAMPPRVLPPSPPPPRGNPIEVINLHTRPKPYSHPKIIRPTYSAPRFANIVKVFAPNVHPRAPHPPMPPANQIAPPEAPSSSTIWSRVRILPDGRIENLAVEKKKMEQPKPLNSIAFPFPPPFPHSNDIDWLKPVD
jgi:hypothetical protein